VDGHLFFVDVSVCRNFFGFANIKNLLFNVVWFLLIEGLVSRFAFEWLETTKEILLLC